MALQDSVSSVAAVDLPKFRPYRSAGPMFQIGLQPMDPTRWLDISRDYAAFMPEKRARLAARPELYYKTVAFSLDAQRELRDRVIAHLIADHPNLFAIADGKLACSIDKCSHDIRTSAIEPLAVISQIVEEDFIILQGADGRDLITAASNIYSSSGRLVASVGRDMAWAHQPVPMLNDQLGGRIDRILGNIRDGSPVERYNWFLTPIASRFFPDDPHAANAAAAQHVASALASQPGRAGDLLWIRVERQTLLRLPKTGALAFGIYTYVDPLSSIARDPESLCAMESLLRAYSEERLRYSAMAPLRAPVLKWLEAQIGRSSDQRQHR
jgi:dimethylamine monooxygenase subunit A